MKFFVRHLRATRSGILMMLAIQGSVFLFGVLMVLGINAFLNEDQDYAAMGSMMALLGGVLGGGIAGGYGASVRYRMAVSMGRTRTSYILSDPVVTALHSLLGIGTAWVLNRLELWLYGLLYPGWELSLDVFSYFEWYYVPILASAVCVISFCLGALQLRFGPKGFAAVWFPLCFGPMIASNSIAAVKNGSDSLLAQIGRGLLFLAGLLRPGAWRAVGAVVLLALVALSAVCYRRAEVRM